MSMIFFGIIGFLGLVIMTLFSFVAYGQIVRNRYVLFVQICLTLTWFGLLCFAMVSIIKNVYVVKENISFWGFIEHLMYLGFIVWGLFILLNHIDPKPNRMNHFDIESDA